MLKHLNTITLLILLMFSFYAMAEKTEYRVFDLKKTLPIDEKEKIYYDYYLSLGSDQGVQPGDVINVYRRVPIVDNYSTINHNDMQIAVGQLKIIYSQPTMSIGRIIKHKRPANMPVLEFEKIMIGDRVEMGTRTVATKD